MKRDMELVRRLLVLVEELDSPFSQVVVPEDIDKVVAVYHLKIMEQAGLVKTKVTYADNVPWYIYSELTWDGHEFLDAVRNETVWKSIKKLVKDKGGSIPFEIMKTLALDLVRKYIS